jgi:hypothetical protein
MRMVRVQTSLITKSTWYVVLPHCLHDVLRCGVFGTYAMTYHDISVDNSRARPLATILSSHCCIKQHRAEGGASLTVGYLPC